ncbi:hypothetical protein FS749_004762 [Ceratobasidium sp. UAMH 11750]|nr:hypothetical protein FS749_004762 [Ceratobasidium sp. UAMH 11750]
MIHKVVCPYQDSRSTSQREDEGGALLWQAMRNAIQLGSGYEQRRALLKQDLEPAMRNTGIAQSLMVAMNVMKMLVRAERLNRLLENRLDTARVIEESLCDRVRNLEAQMNNKRGPRSQTGSPVLSTSLPNPSGQTDCFTGLQPRILADRSHAHGPVVDMSLRRIDGPSIFEKIETLRSPASNSSLSPSECAQSSITRGALNHLAYSGSLRRPMPLASPPVAELQMLGPEQSSSRSYSSRTSQARSLYNAGPPPPRPAPPFTASQVAQGRDTRQVNAPSIGNRLRDMGILFWDAKVIGLYGFKGSSENELSFSRGEVMRLGMHANLEDNFDWMYCKSERGEGYAPKSYLAILALGHIIMFILQECSVCFEDFDDTRNPYSIPCGHVFCRPCLDTLRSTQNCPNCRAVYTTRSVRQVVCPQQDEPSTSAPTESEAETLIWQAIQSSVEAPDQYEQRKSLVIHNPPESVREAGMSGNLLTALDTLQMTVTTEERNRELMDEVDIARAVEESLRDRISVLETQLSRPSLTSVVSRYMQLLQSSVWLVKTKLVRNLPARNNSPPLPTERASPSLNVDRPPQYVQEIVRSLQQGNHLSDASTSASSETGSESGSDSESDSELESVSRSDLESSREIVICTGFGDDELGID